MQQSFNSLLLRQPCVASPAHSVYNYWAADVARTMICVFMFVVGNSELCKTAQLQVNPFWV